MSKTISLSQALDQAVASLPLLRRVTTQWRFRRNPEYRSAVLNELAIKLVDDERAVEILGTQFCEDILCGRSTVETAMVFEVDRIDNLERLLKIIVEYLPQILAIVLRLFGAFVLVFAMFVVLPTSTASAQHWTYPGSIEHHLRADHGIDTRGMSQSQMLYMHDSLHESGRTPATSKQRFTRLRIFRR